MVNVCVACLREGIVENPDIVDGAMVLGTGFAPFRGGPLRSLGRNPWSGCRQEALIAAMQASPSVVTIAHSSIATISTTMTFQIACISYAHGVSSLVWSRVTRSILADAERGVIKPLLPEPKRRGRRGRCAKPSTRSFT